MTKGKRRKRKTVDANLADAIHRYAQDPPKAPRRKAGRKRVSQSYTVIETATDLRALGVSQDTIGLIWGNASGGGGSERFAGQVDRLLKETIKDRKSAHTDQLNQEIANAKKKHKANVRRDQEKAKAITNFCRLVRAKWPAESADHYLQTLVTRIAAYKKTNKDWAAKVKIAIGTTGPVYEALSKHVKFVTKITFEPELIRKRMDRAIL